jgi:hypothetical protein
MQNYQDNIEDLSKCTVAIQETGENGRILGTGILVTDDGLIVTCYHVIGNIKAKTLDKTVDVYFPAIYNVKGRADVLEEYSNSEVDIAFVKLKEKLPEQVAVANLSETIDSTHTFRSFGFRKEKTFDGLYSDGTIQGKVRKKFKDNSNDNNILLQEVIQLKSDGIDHGMSGAAVLDTQINRIIGIVSEYLATSSNVDRNLALAIPIESLLKVYPELRQENPGLRIKEFLRKIGLEGSKLYEKIDELFIPPLEYEKIKEILTKKRIVFITGEQEYGKTYTAFHILWEYYNSENRYEPKYIQARSEEEDDILGRLQRIDETLNHKIIYFEDPFGKTNYERNKKLEDNIGRIIQNLKLLDNVYIIITSRDNVFGEFESSKTTGTDLNDYRKNLNINSYDYKKRQEMLFKWAAALDCEWIHHDELSDIVTTSIEHVKKLPTSLNIRDFVIATIDVNDEQKLLKILDEKSEETAKSFAKEVKEMSQDKILFFSFPFISDNFSLDLVKNKYGELAEELDIKIDNWEFDRILRQFRGSKVDTSKEYIRFSHPSYSEALSYLLLEHEEEEEKIPSKINTEIFSKVLIRLTNEKVAHKDIARIVANNFDRLTEDVRNECLLKLANNKDIAEIATSIISGNCDKLDKDLLIKLANKKEITKVLEDAIIKLTAVPILRPSPLTAEIHAMKRKHGKVTVEYRNGQYHVSSKKRDKTENDLIKLLYMLAPTGKTSKVFFAYAFYHFENHFDELPESLRNQCLLKFTEQAKRIGNGINQMVALAINNFDKLPGNVRSDLVLLLANEKEAANFLSYVLSTGRTKLSENVRNDLLLELVNNEESARNTCIYIYKIFDKLPKNIRNECLLRLANGELLLKLDNTRKPDTDFVIVIYYVIRTICENFEKLPKYVRNLLFDLVDSIETRKVIQELIDGIETGRVREDIFAKLPKNIRNEFTSKLKRNT